MVYRRYGSPEDVSIESVPVPDPGAGQVRVRMHASSLNLADWEMLTGSPLYSRIWGLWRPRFQTLGSDIAGVVDAVGDGVDALRTGDEVFGDVMGSFGAFAEYACVPAKRMVRKPPGLSFEDAATLPQAGVIALRGMVEVGAVSQGQRVLINGAGGGSGTFAIQMAKARGAHVTAVDNGSKQAFMSEAGADTTVDFTLSDPFDGARRYDVILDLVAHRSLFECRRAVEAGGRYMLVGGAMGPLLQSALLGPIVSALSGRKLGVLSVETQPEDLQALADLALEGAITPTIERCFPLDDIADALSRVGSGQALGKLVITY